jgi:dolichol-phosphate mannosyltransferase
MTLYGYALEVLVVDNGSTDRTCEVAAAAGARVIREPRRGKGYAVRTAFDNLSEDTDLVIMLDGDNTYRADEAMRLLEPITSGFCSVVVGSRLGGRIVTGSMPPVNRTGNWVYSHLVRYAYRINVTDVLTGYFAWHRDAIAALRPHLTSSGFTIEMEMITKMARLGHQMCSVPISYQPRHGASSLKPLRDGASILGVCARNLRCGGPAVRRPRSAGTGGPPLRPCPPHVATGFRSHRGGASRWSR